MIGDGLKFGDGMYGMSIESFNMPELFCRSNGIGIRSSATSSAPREKWYRE